MTMDNLGHYILREQRYRVFDVIFDEVIKEVRYLQHDRSALCEFNSIAECREWVLNNIDSHLRNRINARHPVNQRLHSIMEMET